MEDEFNSCFESASLRLKQNIAPIVNQVLQKIKFEFWHVF
ncbi:hypothetical protein C900_03734 [Fulvivirga imtechensis AK7]|uniref:Uncharacterized protein n=1 Tax=Fulvivirga imtechensis AK7 TaxID=1237149 RepID=L8JNQ8_9BACT|nr:hypothetical protein C900_03734 [Fulvivirga imtechensis AK7]